MLPAIVLRLPSMLKTLDGTAGAGTPGLSGQLTKNAGDMACGKRVLADQVIDVFQSNLANGFWKGLTPERLADNIGQFQSSWTGFMAYLTPRNDAGIYSVHGKYIARIGGNPAHFVTVESVTNGIR